MNVKNRLTTPDVKEIQKHLILLAKKLIKIAEKYKINYHFSFGTVLGAIRHKGFIPWDDDMDFCVIGEDYERFLKIIEKESDLYVLTKEKHPTYSGMFAKVMDNNYHYIEGSSTGKETWHRGLFIDIFKLSSLKEGRHDKTKLFYFLSYLDIVKNIKMTNGWLRLVQIIFWPFYFWIPQNWLNKKMASEVNKFESREIKDFLIDIYNSDPAVYYKREWVVTSDEVNFENIKIKIPSNYQEYLKARYGSHYMSLPPQKERWSHCKEFKVLNKKKEL